MSDELREVLSAICLWVVLAIGCVCAMCALGCSEARADYVLAFHGPHCQPCELMVPVETQVRQEGCDVRTVNVEARKDLAAYYRIRRWPTYVYVVSTARGDFDSGCRIVGRCSAGQLRRFCVMPGLTTFGAAARNVVRAVGQCPLLEW